MIQNQHLNDLYHFIFNAHPAQTITNIACTCVQMIVANMGRVPLQLLSHIFTAIPTRGDVAQVLVLVLHSPLLVLDKPLLPGHGWLHPTSLP